MTELNSTFVSVPNQRIITVKREPAKSDFLGIKNENWQAAARNLSPHAMMLYFYIASNADNYTFALSPAAVRQTIGMARSTYHDQFHNLVDKGYLVPIGGIHFVFYEKPHKEENPSNVNTNQKFTDAVSDIPETVNIVLPKDIEINNIQPNNLINKGEFTQSKEIKESVSTFIF